MHSSSSKVTCRGRALPLALSLFLAGCGPDEVSGRSDRDAGTEAGLPDGGHLPSPVTLENQKPGATDFDLQKPAMFVDIAGYTSKISVAAGDGFDVHVDVTAPHGVSWKLYRLGYYQGLGARLVASGGPLQVSPQPACPVDAVTGLVECHWAPAFHVQTGQDWVSGYYIVKLVRDDGFDTYVPVMVKEATPRAPLLVQASVTTWQAYNYWGGTSLYANRLPQPRVFVDPHAFKVSFDRPLTTSIPTTLTGLNASQLGAAVILRRERPLVTWLEQRGYDVGYTTNVDVHEAPGSLLGRRLFVSSAHDEYWTIGERDAVEKARDSGVSVAFLSANTSYWRIRLEPSTGGVPDRVITCYKGDPRDPRVGQPDQTVQFRQDPYPRPENSLVGVMYELYTHYDSFPFIVSNAQHWIYAGTGLSNGDSLGNVVGYEWDHVWNDANSPKGLEIVATSPAFGVHGTVAPHDATVYYPTDHSFVFASGTIDFTWALAQDGYTNGSAQRIIDNVVARAGMDGDTPPSYAPPLLPKPGSAGDVTVLAGDGQAGFVEGPASSARFDTPAGLAVAADGTVFVADSRNHRIRAISTTGAVSTLSGCGPTSGNYGYYTEGTGAAACFNLPTALAVGPDGALYVADTGNNVIRRVLRDGTVTTYAGSGAVGAADGALLAASFDNPQDLAFAPDGSLYVADTESRAVRRITATAVTTVATNLVVPSGIAVATDGTVFVAASAEGRLYSINGGVTSVLANTTGTSGSLDGPATSARLRPGSGMAVVGTKLVFADTANNAVRVLDLSQAVVSRFLGTGGGGRALGTGASTELALPRGLALSGSRLLVSDSANHRILSVAAP